MEPRKKPAQLTYGVDDRPGWGTTLLLGLQHICVQSVSFILPVLIIQEIGGTPRDAGNLICMAMIASGAATLFQAVPRGPMGSGYLCPLINGPAYLSASLLAGQVGGLPLIFGMTAVGGAFEALLSRIVPRMRALFPSEVTGTVVTMVGVEIISIAMPKFFGVDDAHPVPTAAPVAVGAITLLAMAGFTVWGRGRLRLYSVLLGLLLGYTAALLTGVLSLEQLGRVREAPFFAVPEIGHFGLSFRTALLVPFLVATLASALKTMGDLTTCQKMNDAEWRRSDLHNISRGILACSAGNLLSGLIGALGQSVSSSNIGLAIASGAASRRIAYANGALLILLAFCPKPAAVFVIMPAPIMGASVIFAVSFMILAGIQILTSRMIDARKTFVIGFSIIFGLSVDLVPDLYAHLPAWLRPFFQSSLSVSALSAVCLNLLFRIGIGRRKILTLDLGRYASQDVFAFMERQGGLWGARRDVMYQAGSALNELAECLAGSEQTTGELTVETVFDEFNLDLYARYQGPPVELATEKPGKQQLREDPRALARLAGYLVRQYADAVTTRQECDTCLVHLHFIH